MLRRWATRTFGLPWTHELIQSATRFELLSWYWEDLFVKEPRLMLEASKDERGEIVFDETGDPLLDKWESEIARGITPDLEEGLPPQEKERLRRERAQMRRGAEARAELLGGEGAGNESTPQARSWSLAARLASKAGEGK